MLFRSGKKALAAFHADHGDYSLTDAAMLAKLATKGEHALTFTVITSTDSDLLTGMLDNHGVATQSAAAHGHSGKEYLIWGLSGLLLLAALVVAIRFIRALRRSRQPRFVEASK